ncbi:MAG: methyltransferase domain-containing protein [Phycisphaerae bacterium]|jgi:SAM-dependent methyltransferase|nr:methyltransferase domain-containing protein [Phycisphaerae bacterium]
MTAQNDNIWHGSYKIPWNDPDFSRRMLAEHLAQDHDLASRRTEWIDRQVAWIHDDLLGGQPASILDLGCGPGFYSHRLTMRGHRCYGIDFGPASIEYALRHNPDESRCTFVLGDIRQVAFGGPYDLAMILYGELNVFSPAEALAVLRKAHTALTATGRLIVEMQTPQTVHRTGLSEPTEQDSESGLFSDRPHHCQTESQWLPEQQAAVQTFHITEAGSERAKEFRSTTQAWPDRNLIALFRNAGFHEASPRNDWPSNTDNLKLWLADAKEPMPLTDPSRKDG